MSDVLCSDIWRNSSADSQTWICNKVWLLCALAAVPDCCQDIGVIWGKQAAKPISHPSSLPSSSSSSITIEKQEGKKCQGCCSQGRRFTKCHAFSSFTLKGVRTDSDEISGGLRVFAVGFLLTAQPSSRLHALPLVFAASPAAHLHEVVSHVVLNQHLSLKMNNCRLLWGYKNL